MSEMKVEKTSLPIFLHCVNSSLRLRRKLLLLGFRVTQPAAAVNVRNKNVWFALLMIVEQGGHGTGKTAKTGNLVLTFPDRENTGNFALTQGKILRHRENIFL